MASILSLSDDSAPSASLDRRWRLRPLLRTSNRSLSRLEACHDLRSSPQAGPKLRILRFQPAGTAEKLQSRYFQARWISP